MRRGETQDLDDPERIGELRRRIRSKPALRHWYEECYGRYRDCLEHCPEEGLAIELGAGGSFVQDSIPGIVTSDLLPYEGVDRSVDAMAMPFEDQGVRALLMQNVFHHLPDVSVFLDEARRVLKPGSRSRAFRNGMKPDRLADSTDPSGYSPAGLDPDGLGRGLERTPGVRVFAGSHLVTAGRP